MATVTAFSLPAVNPNANKTGITQLRKFLGTSSGVFSVGMAVSNTADLIREGAHLAGHSEWSASLKEVSSFSKGIVGGLAVPRFVELSLGLPDTIQHVFDHVSEGSIVKCFKDLLGWISTGCTTASMITKDAQWKTPGKVASLADGAVSLYEGGSLWLKARASRARGSELQQRAADETQTLSLLRILKAVCGIALGVIGMLGLYFGAAVVSTLVLCILAFTASVFGTAAHFYEQNMTRLPLPL